MSPPRQKQGDLQVGTGTWASGSTLGSGGNLYPRPLELDSRWPLGGMPSNGMSKYNEVDDTIIIILRPFCIFCVGTV